MNNPFVRLVIAIATAIGSVDSQIHAEQVKRARHEPLTIYITGSRLPVSKNEKPGSVITITRNEIKRSAARSITEVLQSVSGLSVENSNSRGSISPVYLRGAEANYTLVLIDGVKVNDPTGSRGDAFDFSTLDLDMVERIEIVKGPASSIYGSSALAGVINIVTHQPVSKLINSLRTTIGSHKYGSSMVKTSIPFATGGFSLAAAYIDEGDQIEGSKYIGKSLNTAGHVTVNHSTKLAATARVGESNSNSFPDASGGAKFAISPDVDDRRMKHRQLSLSLIHALEGQDVLRINMSYFNNKEAMTSPELDSLLYPANSARTGYNMRDVLGFYQSNVKKKYTYSLGIQMQWEKGYSDGEIDSSFGVFPAPFRINRRFIATFAELNYEITQNFNVFTRVRVDKPDSFKSKVSPGIGVNYQYKSTTYILNWGRGFKLPSFFALGHPLVGNPNFKPETSESLQLDIVLDISPRHRIEYGVFNSKYFDLIDFADSGFLVARPEVQIIGVELRDNVQLSRYLALNANLTLMDFQIKSSDQKLKKRPEKLANVQLNWKLSRFTDLSGKVTYVGKQEDFSFPTGNKTIDSYTRTDVALGWIVRKNISLQFTVNNLLDKRYQESIGAEVPGRIIRLSLEGNY